MNHETERTSRVLAESLRIRFEVEQGRGHRGAILVPPGSKLHSVKTWGDTGGGERGGVGWVRSCQEKANSISEV